MLGLWGLLRGGKSLAPLGGKKGPGIDSFIMKPLLGNYSPEVWGETYYIRGGNYKPGKPGGALKGVDPLRAHYGGPVKIF